MNNNIKVLNNKDFTKYIKSIKQNDKNEEFFNSLIKNITPYFNEVVSKITQQKDEQKIILKKLKKLKKY